MSIRDYYDDFATRQLRVGVNERHRSIHRSLRRFGLQRGSRVLEIGCGIGTVTGLIARTVGDAGSVVAVDLSEKSVDVARRRLERHANVELIAGDVVEVALDRRFDVVVMPDVLEHIPIEDHARLFGRVRGWLEDAGFVFVHIPNPFFLEWCHAHRPELLQVLDQPIHTAQLLERAEPNGFYLHHLETYSIWVPEHDYQLIILKPRPDGREFRLGAMPSSFRGRMASAARRLASSAIVSRDGLLDELSH
jgi:trans-aconitate 2-methyltransferase